MIEKPIIERKPTVLTYTEDGAFDIPTYVASVAINYFSGTVFLKDSKMKLLKGEHTVGCE